jgi:hypothetical protein
MSGEAGEDPSHALLQHCNVDGLCRRTPAGAVGDMMPTRRTEGEGRERHTLSAHSCTAVVHLAFAANAVT